MAVYSGIYAIYERLASAKMNAMVSAINAHTHDGIYGVKINFSDLEGTISGSQIPDGTIGGNHIQENAITYYHIDENTIKWENIDQTSIVINNDKYAVYAP